MVFEEVMWARFRRRWIWICLALSCPVADQIRSDLSFQAVRQAVGRLASGRVSGRCLARDGPLVCERFQHGTLKAPQATQQAWLICSSHT